MTLIYFCRIFSIFNFLITHTLFSLGNSNKKIIKFYFIFYYFAKMSMVLPSKEAKRMINFQKQYGENDIKNVDFCTCFKVYSKKEKGQKKGSIYHKSIHNYDIAKVLVWIRNKIDENARTQHRCTYRSNYGIKNKMFNFYAVNEPDLMREIPNHLHELEIDEKLTNITEFNNRWYQCIDDAREKYFEKLEFYTIDENLDDFNDQFFDLLN